MRLPAIALAAFCMVGALLDGAAATAEVAEKPLYRDPVFDGAADPVVIYNPLVQRWWMFYTNRRANADGLRGVSWVHGTEIGIAESTNGAQWRYVGTAAIDVPEELASANPTYWAPEVVRAGPGDWRMFLTVVPGVFENWSHPRQIVQLKSTDLRHWGHAEPLSLANDKVIDATALKMPDGRWRLWYNNERDGKSIWMADSPDLESWSDQGRVLRQRGEGPKVFRWRGHYWMVIDLWRGLGVFRSTDGQTWNRQPELLLSEAGTGKDDQVIGQHADVLVNNDQAYLFYFTHPGRRGEDRNKDTSEQRRSSIQVTQLHVHESWLTCDRDAPTSINLQPPLD